MSRSRIHSPRSAVFNFFLLPALQCQQISKEMGRLRRSRTHSSAKSQQKTRKSKRYTRDLDQIAMDMELAQSIRSIKTNTTKKQTKQNETGNETGFVVPQKFGSTSHPTVTGDVDEDTIGFGQFPCVQCARFFVDSRSLSEHQKGKVHKRRVKDIAAGPYTLEEAMRAAGIGTDNQQRPVADLMAS